jgi:hypothetical protein
MADSVSTGAGGRKTPAPIPIPASCSAEQSPDCKVEFQDELNDQ